MNKIVLEILKKIKQAGFSAYVVGGYSRDLYLGKTNKDIDICTNAKYKDLTKIFSQIEEVGYLSYRLTYHNQVFEITTYRKETIYIKKRFPVVKYARTLKQDLKRRDFTINTLCIDENGNYIDKLNAKKDIDNKIIKIVGNKKKIKQDSLRILRTIRFATILGFKIDKKLEKAIIKYKENLNELSMDRKKQELEKILTSPNAQYGIDLIKKYNLEPYLKINLSNCILTQNINGIWAQILIDDSYNLKKEDRKEIMLIKELKNKRYDIYNLYKYNQNIIKTVSEIQQKKIDIEKEYKNLKIKDRDEIKINYIDICNAIEATSNNINKIYEDLEKKIIHGKLKNQKREIIKYLKQKYQK